MRIEQLNTIIKRVKLLISLALFILNMHSQTRDNWIMFNDNTINFRNLNPKPIKNTIKLYPNESNNNENVYSDKCGNIKFFNHNNYLYNQYRQRIPFSQIDTLIYKDIIPFGFIKAIGNDSLYYFIYSYNPLGSPNWKYILAYNEVFWNNGYGRIGKRAIEILPQTNRNIMAMKHANNRDFWLISAKDTSTIFSVLVSDTGISKFPIKNINLTNFNWINNPIIYSSKLTFYGDYFYCKSNYHQTKLYFYTIYDVNNPNIAILEYDFNKNNGTISNKKIIYTYSQIPFNHAIADVCTSSSDTFLYINVSPTRTTPAVDRTFQLLQYNLYTKKTKIIYSTKNDSFSNAQSLTTNNGKIYLATITNWRANSNSLTGLYNVINYPNKLGVNCAYQKTNWPRLTNLFRYDYNLQPAPTFNFRSNLEYRTCADSLLISLQGDTNFSYFTAYWGDGDSTNYNTITSGIMKLSHKYGVEGKYFMYFKGFTKGCNNPYYYSDTVDVKFPPKRANKSPRLVQNMQCRYNTLTVYDTMRYCKGWRIYWGDGADSFYYGSDAYIDPVEMKHSYTKTGNYTVKIILYNKYGCEETYTATRNIDFLPHTKLKITTDTLLCKYASGYLQADSLIPSDTIFVKTKEQNLGLGYYKTGSNFSYTHYYGKDTLRFIAKSSAGCEDTLYKPILVKYSPRIKAIFVNDSVQCSKQNSFILRTEPVVIDTNKITYTWSSTKAGNITYLNTEKTWAKLENYPIGKYSIAVSAVSANGCTDVKLKRIQVIQNPKAAFTIPTFCQNQGITIKNQDTLGSLPIKTYSWKLSSASPLLTSNFLLLTPDTNLQTLTHVLTDTFGCSDTITKTLKANAKPFPNWTLDKNTVCTNNASINITETNAQNTNRQIAWNTNAGLNNAKNTNAFTYTSKGQKNILCIASNSNCSDTQRFIVQVWESPTASAIIPALCKGQAATFFSNSKAGDASINQYNWKIENQNQSGANVNFTPIKTGALQITHSVIDANNCSDDTIINTIVADTPQVSISAEPYGLTDKFLYEFIANPSTYKTYTWTIQNANYSGANVQAELTGTNAIYTLKVTTEAGCSSHYRDTVDVLGLFAFNVPDVIRPLSQLDTNRGFGFIGANYVKEYHLRIYNRWGSKIFETRNPYQRWIPTNAIKGNYIYKIEARDVYNRYKEIKGVFVVIE